MRKLPEFYARKHLSPIEPTTLQHVNPYSDASRIDGDSGYSSPNYDRKDLQNLQIFLDHIKQNIGLITVLSGREPVRIIALDLSKMYDICAIFNSRVTGEEVLHLFQKFIS